MLVSCVEHTRPERTRGPLLLIGGAEDKVGGRTILNRFVQLAGGSSAHILIVATASSFYDWVGQRYTALFKQLGAAHAEVLHARTRQEALSSIPLEQLQHATGIFITGGDQLKLTAVLGGTALERRIRELNNAGVVVGGTSAGASVASEHMMAYGMSGPAPRRAMMQFAPGMGLISGVIIDQHFGARGRSGRLITAVAHNPGLLGIGLDEDTAVEIHADNTFTVLGRGSVFIADGSHVSYTDIHHVPDHAPLTIFGLTMHVLSSGYRYDMHTRTPQAGEWSAPPEPEYEGISGEGI